MSSAAPGHTETEAPASAGIARHQAAVPALSDSEVHVWVVSLDREGASAELEALLSDEERDRASRFRHAVDRRRYVVGRGTVRELLGAYLGASPRHLTLATEAHGKPVLHAASPALHFNLSHAEHLAVLAVSRVSPLGVDVELVKAFPELEQVADHMFAEGERRRLRALSPAARVEAFYACWTRKEAIVKATGHGLSFPLDAFEVTLGPTDAPALLSLRDAPDEPREWMLRSLAPAPGFIGALALRTGATLNVRLLAR